MTARTLDVDATNAALSDLVGHAVRLVTVDRPAGAITTVAPVDVRMRQAPFWQAALVSPLPMAWPSAEQAVVGFAASVATCVAAGKRGGRLDPKTALLDRLAGGPLPAADLYCTLAAAGISRDQADRAARRIGVVRRKAGMRGPWVWGLPDKASAMSSLPRRDQATNTANTAETEINQEKAP